MKQHYKSFVYFNFDEEEELSSIFESNKNPQRIVELLGTLLAQPKSYPVGMVNLLELYPLYFDEFLAVINKTIYQYYLTIQKSSTIEEIFHSRLLEMYDYYLMIGGMPECVSSWAKHKDPQKIAQIQKELIAIYENDFAKDNEKFVYGCVREGARARKFEDAIEWLVSAGMLNRIYNVSRPEHPLSAFDQLTAFKLFVFDTGLLKQMAGIDNSAILLKSNYQFKGALTENYLLQQLKGQLEIIPRYYADKQGEIDFVLQCGTAIIPVEVKGGEDKSAPSFKSYIKTRQPELALRFSKMGYRKDGAISNIPLYLAAKTTELV